jgi:hypothetical protein
MMASDASVNRPNGKPSTAWGWGTEVCECLVLFFGGIAGGGASISAFRFGLELFDRGTDQGNCLSMPGPRGYRSCVEGIFLNLAVEKRAFGRLWQVPVHSEVIQAAHKGALHAGHIGLLQRFDAGQLLRVRQWGCST